MKHLKKTWFYKNGHISANYGPILKIQNLAQGTGADLADFTKTSRDDVTRAHDVIAPGYHGRHCLATKKKFFAPSVLAWHHIGLINAQNPVQNR